MHALLTAAASLPPKTVSVFYYDWRYLAAMLGVATIGIVPAIMTARSSRKSAREQGAKLDTVSQSVAPATPEDPGVLPLLKAFRDEATMWFSTITGRIDSLDARETSHHDSVVRRLDEHAKRIEALEKHQTE